MKIEILDEAQQDLIDGYRFYEHQSAGLGAYFIDALLADIESLRLYAGIHSTHWGYHRILAKRFPYAVYYQVTLEVVRVHAVLDCRRSPASTRERLS